jgi:dUTP pyrophosphatase
MDLYAAEDIHLMAQIPTLVHTGLVAQIPEGYELQVRSRSGMALKRGIVVFNSPGTIDSGYVGEIGVILCRLKSWYDDGFIRKGDRIAQLVLAPVTTCHPVEVQEIENTERGAGGFGSTGK